MKIIVHFLVICVLITTTGCGGGGGSDPSGPVTSTNSFPLRSGFDALIENGETISLTANGTAATESTNGLCSGTFNQTTGPATGVATFESTTPALAAVSVTTISFSNCPSLAPSTDTSYYDTNFLPLGFDEENGEYGVSSGPFIIPNSVMVGHAGIIGTITVYNDSSKNVVNGREDLSFVVEPDTASTAIVNLITKSYDSSSQLLFTEQDRYRITTTGALTLVSIDAQFAPPDPVHLVFR